jgi:hypothetical protein
VKVLFSHVDERRRYERHPDGGEITKVSKETEESHCIIRTGRRLSYWRKGGRIHEELLRANMGDVECPQFGVQHREDGGVVEGRKFNF